MAIIRADEPYEGPESPIVPSGPSDLHNVFNRRALYWARKHEAQSELLSVYNGEIPPEYEELFHPEQRRHIVNMLRLSTDDLAGMTGQEMPLFFPPENDTPTAKDRAEKFESICYGYNAAGRKNGGVDMKGLQIVQGFFMVLMAECVYMVLPDDYRKTPFFTFRDPRTHYPPIGWSPWEQSALDGTLFAYRLPLAEVKRRWPHKTGELDAVYTKKTSTQTTGWKATSNMEPHTGHDEDENRWIWIGEYYQTEAWYLATLEDKSITLFGAENDTKGFPNVCPAVGHGLYNPEMARSLLADQISIQFAESRLLSQTLEYNDKSIHPPIFGTKLRGDKVKYGPGAYNEFDPQAAEKPVFFQAAPPNPVHSDQMMQFAIVLLRMLNRNPEALQGAGDANSAKAISELKSGVSGTVQQHFWPPMQQALPQLYGKAVRLDINRYGKERKRISGMTPETHRTKRGLRVRASYRATEFIGYEDECEIEPGIMLRGYQGRLEIMQLLGAGIVSETTALELLDIVRDPREEAKRLQSDRIRKIVLADLEAAAAQQQLAPGSLFDIIDRTQKGEDLFDVIADLSRSERLKLPPAPPPGEQPALGPGGGAPPGMEQLAAALEGGGAPSLELLQGGSAA